jgi:hypothetical protein
MKWASIMWFPAINVSRGVLNVLVPIGFMRLRSPAVEFSIIQD